MKCSNWCLAKAVMSVTGSLPPLTSKDLILLEEHGDILCPVCEEKFIEGDSLTIKTKETNFIPIHYRCQEQNET